MFNCSTDDDNTTNLDLNLLYGQWYRVDLCSEQNSLFLDANGTYESFSSGAVDCDMLVRLRHLPLGSKAPPRQPARAT